MHLSSNFINFAFRYDATPASIYTHLFSTFAICNFRNSVSRATSAEIKKRFIHLSMRDIVCFVSTLFWSSLTTCMGSSTYVLAYLMAHFHLIVLQLKLYVDSKQMTHPILHSQHYASSHLPHISSTLQRMSIGSITNKSSAKLCDIFVPL